MRQLALGGYGLIQTGATYVETSGIAYERQLGIHSDAQVAGLTEMATAIRAGGGLSAVQLHHAGHRADPALGGIPSPAPDDSREPGWQGTPELAAAALTEAGLPASLTGFLDDASRDAEIQAESDEALTLTGKDVGTPIVHFEPPAGVAFFGPVISRLPDEQQAAQLWDHVVGLARFPGFAELKRSLREQPQLPSFGVTTNEAGTVEDWHAGSRRLKK